LKEGNAQAITPATIIDDEPTTFWFDEKPYEPAITRTNTSARFRLVCAGAFAERAGSEGAEMVGYDKVALTARAAGLNVDIKATPSIALGAYEVTPLEIAGAYTVFANNGSCCRPVSSRISATSMEPRFSRRNRSGATPSIPG